MIPTILSTLYLGILALDFRAATKSTSTLNKVIYVMLLTVGLIIAQLNALGISIGTPTTPIESAVRMIFHVE